MIHQKAFHLKIRKQGVRWGCPCCQPVGRDIKRKSSRELLAKRVHAGKLKERNLFTRLMMDEIEE